MLNLKRIILGMGLVGALSSIFACECQSVDKVIQKELSIKGAASTISSIALFSKN